MLEQDNGENLHKIHNDKALIDIALTTHNKDLRYKIIDRYSLEVFSYIAKQRLGYNISKGHSDNSNVEEYRKIQSDEDYEDAGRINFDNITNEDIEKFLKDF